MANHVLLERIELNASTTSVTFANIPQTGYTDLKIVASTRDTNATANNGLFSITLNGSTTFTSAKNVSGNGASAGSGTGDIFVGGGDTAGNTANTFSNVEVYFPNYTSTTQKSVSAEAVSEQNGTTAYMALTAQLFNLTTAITSISIAGRSGFAQYSAFSLYGIAAVGSTPAIAPKASGGNITTDGTYWIHTFNASGTFIPQTALSCDYLVVAGGGAGGAEIGGGGGAGGLRSGSNLSISASSFAVVVGAGGAGVSNSSASNIANPGNASTFSTISASGGGKGGSNTGAPIGTGGNGGSGGGGGDGGEFTYGSGNSGGYSPVEGYNGGGTTDVAPAYGSGGGGGASQAGFRGTSAVGGNGGAGLASSITGTSVTYAGGGGGSVYSSAAGTNGVGGTGGGGNGGNYNQLLNGTSGTANTGGGGGGGGGTTGSSPSGGSGIVIIRYPI